MKAVSYLGSALVLFLTRICGTVLLIVQVAIVAFLHGIEFVGFNGILWSAAVIFRVAGPLGLDVMAVRDAGQSSTAESITFIRSLAIRDTFALLRIWLPIVGVVMLLWPVGLAMGLTHGVMLPAVALACTASLFHRLWFMSLVSLGKAVFGQIVESLCLPLLAIIASVIVPSTDLVAFILGQTAAILFISAVLGFSVFSSSRGTRTQVPRIRWSGALLVAAGASLTALAVRSPIFFVGATSARAAGEYDLAQRFQSAGSLGVSAISTAVMPRLSQSIHSGRHGDVRRLLVIGGITAASIPAFLVIVLSVAGNQILGLLGPQYQPLLGPALVLTVSSLLNALTSSVSNALSLNGSERSFAAIAGLQLVSIVFVAFVVGGPSALEMSFIVVGSECFRSVLLLLFYHRSSNRRRVKHRLSPRGLRYLYVFRGRGCGRRRG